MVDAATGRPAFGTSLVKIVDGVRIGIIGLTTPAGPCSRTLLGAAGCVSDPLEVARAEVARLRGAGAPGGDRACPHGPRARPGGAVATRAPSGRDPNENMGYRLAYEVPGIDVVILGHTHQVIPSVVIGSALVTQAGKFGEALGRIDLKFTRVRPREWQLARALPAWRR